MLETAPQSVAPGPLLTVLLGRAGAVLQDSSSQQTVSQEEGDELPTLPSHTGDEGDALSWYFALHFQDAHVRLLHANVVAGASLPRLQLYVNTVAPDASAYPGGGGDHAGGFSRWWGANTRYRMSKGRCGERCGIQMRARTLSSATT